MSTCMLKALPVCAALALLALAPAFQHKKPVAKKKPAPHKVAKVTFAQVATIAKRNCIGCHSGAHPKHGLDLTSYAMIMKGDKEGKVVVPKDAGSSRLSKSVHRKGAAPMPPAGPLPASDVALIDAWIKAGAPSK